MENYTNWKLLKEAMEYMPSEEQEIAQDIFPELKKGKVRVSAVELAVALRLLPGQFLIDNDPDGEVDDDDC